MKDADEEYRELKKILFYSYVFSRLSKFSCDNQESLHIVVAAIAAGNVKSAVEGAADYIQRAISDIIAHTGVLFG